MPGSNLNSPLTATSIKQAANASSLTRLNNRTLFISAIAVFLGILTGFIAKILTSLIGLVTNFFFYGTFSIAFSSPRNNHLGLFVIAIPIIGALIVGLMARYGSKGIRGHGIPEAMEQVLVNQSKIAPRLTFLKPLSAAFSIGTGGPFGAEGPIIATGGALGSLIGQLLKINADERKILLAAGAAGGMAATFGSPVSAILLAIELLLFEFKPRSFIPVMIASLCASATRISFEGIHPVFQMNVLAAATNTALVSYFVLGMLIGVVAVGVTKSVYFIEDQFDKLPIHWMWWPAIGGLVVGIIGYFVPATLGVGYDNIQNIISGNIGGTVLVVLFVAKFLSWSVSLGSGTSGGTLAPLFTIGGGIGAAFALVAAALFPHLGIDPRMAALVGMAALFTGASRAILTSIVFAFETTLQPTAILPLLACCSSSYLVSIMLMKETIMTEKIARRGIRVPSEYTADVLDQTQLKNFATREVVSIEAATRLSDVQDWLLKNPPRHHTFPVLENEQVIGVITKKELEDFGTEDDLTIKEIVTKPLVVLLETNSIRDAANLMAEVEVYSIPIVADLDSLSLVGIISRHDILKARKEKNNESNDSGRSLSISVPLANSIKARFRKSRGV